MNVKKTVLTHLRKALESGGDGAALNPYDLDPVLHEELLKLQPLAEMLDIIPAGGKTHEYNVRTSHPQAWFEGETTPPNAKNSVYARKSVQTKIQRIWGEVTGFAQAVDAAFIDALATELEGSVEGMANILEFGVMWGAADDIGFTGDPYQYSGIIPRLFALAPGNVIDAGGDKIVLGDLDGVLAKANRFRGMRADPKMWFMSIEMKQVVDGLQTAVQLPLTQAELADGRITMAAYSNVPIFETDFIAPDPSGSSSPADLAAAAGGGSGTLATDEYFYNIASVTVFGEQVAGVEDSASVTGPDDIDLTWTADPNAVLYLIFRGLATGNDNLQLLDIIPALTYDAAGTVNGTVTTYNDDGSKTPVAVKPLSDGEENILLVNRNPQRGAAILGLVDDNGSPIDTLFRYVELAQVKDTYDYMMKGYLASRLVHPNVVGMVRHAKKA